MRWCLKGISFTSGFTKDSVLRRTTKFSEGDECAQSAILAQYYHKDEDATESFHAQTFQRLARRQGHNGRNYIFDQTVDNLEIPPNVVIKPKWKRAVG